MRREERLRGERGGDVGSSRDVVAVLRCGRSGRYEWVDDVKRLRRSQFSCAIPRKVV